MWHFLRIFASRIEHPRMTKKQAIQLFEEKKVRTVWDDEQEKWYFSIVDTVAVLTDSPNPNNYWKVLKHRLKKEGNQSVTNCNQLKLISSDGKSYRTDVADTEQLFRLIQSIPSPSWRPRLASPSLPSSTPKTHYR